MFLRITIFILLIGNSVISFSKTDTAFVFAGESSVPLRGQWDLVMGSFLTYEEVKADTTAKPVKVPGNWDQIDWKERTEKGFGFGTYYTTVVVDGSNEQTLSLEVSEISLAYRLFINDEFIGQVGTPGKTKDATKPKIDHQIFDFKTGGKDTLTIVFHVSNFSHRSGGIWYVPKLGTKQDIYRTYELNKSIKLIIIGFIIIGGIFQLYVFFRRQKDKFGLYFFFVCCSLLMLFLSRGDMPIMDFFPNTSWVTLKKAVYISLFLIGPFNGLFLRELFPKYFNRSVINAIFLIAVGLSLFTLIVPPKVSHPLIAPHNYFNLLIGIYLLIFLVRVAINNLFGARFLLVGYIVAFAAAIHDILSSQHIIDGYSLDMIHVGTIVYIFQLLFVVAGRYIYVIESREKLSANLKKTNDELEEKVSERTIELSNQNQIIELQNERLQKAIEDKDDLMAIVAHDLKAPFDSIYSISELLKKELKDQSADLNSMIKKVTINGKELIENLIQLKTYEQDNFQISKQLFFLDSFFEEKVKTYEKISSEKGIDLISNLEISTAAFNSDQSIMGRIIDNLLSNAIKFSKADSKIFFSLKEEENELIIIVKDNGPGFNEEDKKSVFQKFQKLSAKPTAGESSTGLGLSIAKTLTKLLNGKLELISEENKGSEFILSIPK